jgi:hypothetical protein
MEVAEPFDSQAKKFAIWNHKDAFFVAVGEAAS